MKNETVTIHEVGETELDYKNDLDFKPRGALISRYWDERIIWLMILLCVIALIYYICNPAIDLYWFQNHSEIPSK